MERASELVLRHVDALGDGPVLLINPPRDDLFRALEAHRPIAGFTQDFGDWTWLHNAGATVTFGVTPGSEPDSAGLTKIRGTRDAGTPSADDAPLAPATLVLFLPREKERLEFLLHALADAMARSDRPEAELWLVGENRAGIKSAGKRLANRFADVEKVDNARHCVLFRAREPVSSDPFSLDDYVQKWELPLPAGDALRIASLPGVFAHGRLDAGTALLLDYLASADANLDIGGQVLDFGCGAGVIGLALWRRRPDSHLTLLDTSASALQSAAWSCEANGVPEAQFEIVPADGLPADGPDLDWIVSNPPFHSGVDTNYDIARRFFANSAERLDRNGALLLVCNRHLPYEPWLQEHFAALEKPAENRDFKVLLARRPNTRRGPRRPR